MDSLNEQLYFLPMLKKIYKLFIFTHGYAVILSTHKCMLWLCKFSCFVLNMFGNLTMLVKRNLLFDINTCTCVFLH